ncbi:hypothetical protein [Joostella sp.]|uniref:hypothetical protein n=1 Tax=Joostella sp. TaxID=2231138 RepID=UPI003A8E7B83
MKGKKLFSLPSGEMMLKEPFEYYKREGNRFFFKNKWSKLDFELKGKELYDFVDKYEVGDLVKLFE